MKLIESFFILIAFSYEALAELPSQRLEQNGVYNLWSPASVNASVGYTLKKCEDPTRHRHLVADTPLSGELKKECQPDTFYSWGHRKRLDWVKAAFSRPRAEGFRIENFFLSQSPSGSYGYGLYPIRVKLKPNLVFKVRRSSNNRPCNEISLEEARQTVFLISWEWNGNNGQDYVICHSDVIDSISYGTPEHYDEVVKDVNWALSHPLEEYSLYASSPKGWWYMNGDDQIKTEGGYQPNKEHFEKALSIWVNAISKKEEFIFYNYKIQPSREEHFKTRFPIYYNEQ